MKKKKLTPIKAIRKKCLDCCCYQPKEVRYCQISDCSLHPYRMNMRPETYEKTLATKGIFSKNKKKND